jgi:hypothetical protein
MGLERHSITDKRIDERVPVCHRTRAVGPIGQPLSLVIVDLSANGLMARCDTAPAAGSRIQVLLPIIGMCFAEVRWSLGGRIGCELEQPIGLESYYEVVTMLTRETGTRR